MECLLGMKFNDFVLIAADRKEEFSIINLKADADKITKLSSHLAMAVMGEAGDTTQFAEYIAKNVQLYKMRNGYDLPPSSASHFTRSTLATHLRSREPYQVNVLIGGFDPETNNTHLYYVDHLAAMIDVDYYGFGYGGFFTQSIMDKLYNPAATVEEGYQIFVECVNQIKKRFIVNMPRFKVYCISKKGIKDMKDIVAEGEIV